MFPLLTTTALIQNIEDTSPVQIAFDSMENIFLFISLAILVIVVILIPVYLGFSLIDNYFKIQRHSSKIDNDICCYEENYSAQHIKTICDKYLKAYSRLLKNLSALTVWNVFSLLYIFLGFESFKEGIIEYFNFPLYIFESLQSGEIYSAFYNYSSNWYFMIAISLLTFIFYHIGNYIGMYFGKSSLKKKSLNVSFS